MTQVVTLLDIMKYNGAKMAVFPQGTVVTPSALDWASEHNIEVVCGEAGSDGKSELLRRVIRAVTDNMSRAGGIMKKEELVETVIACLRKLDCDVEK